MEIYNLEIQCTSLQPLINDKALSVGMTGKAAASVLRLQHLLLALQRGGVDGLSHILKAKFNGNLTFMQANCINIQFLAINIQLLLNIQCMPII